MPGKKARKSAQPSLSWAPAERHQEHEVECAIQLRRIGDKLNFRQKVLNVIAKLFHLGT
ncbi:PREDICTED: phorbol-12-myristate-13-acetate-induced protein 1 [Chrysochloris asiatica]|uniref:Phorbol-12-myristate-13-acetate-induced protein 1 n=1 Tax=Chrysochloris asiatica TaxID=185453 RepID=A0A9B0WIJ3_CHRAS|nr:PREDICTED: phorbol-12-myristate-13-acetate-induced protein 1 [Chrysochloris asiatica]